MIAEQFTTGRPLLLIDDNPQNLRLGSFLLKSEGILVRTAESAEHALELLAGERFSMILMDIQLPGMDGLELTRLIRNTPAWAGLPIVALTAYAMRGDEERMLAAGCDGYISKPIDTRSFANQVRQYLKLPGGDSEAVSDPEIASLRYEFVMRSRDQARSLLLLPDIDLGGPDTFVILHRWAGFGGSVGLGRLTDLARDAERHRGEPLADRGLRIRPAITSILAFLESAS